MKKVRCINDTYDVDNLPEWAKNVLTVGDPFPVAGEIYTVTGYYHDKITNEEEAYELEEFAYILENYGAYPLFVKSRFEVVSDEFTPTGFVRIDDNEWLAEKFYVFSNWSNDDIKNMNIELDVNLVEKYYEKD